MASAMLLSPAYHSETRMVRSLARLVPALAAASGQADAGSNSYVEQTSSLPWLINWRASPQMQVPPGEKSAGLFFNLNVSTCTVGVGEERVAGQI